MLSRRQFLTRSGAVGAAVLFTPQDALGARRAPARREVLQRRDVRRPDAARDHAVDAGRGRRRARRRPARGRARQGLPQGRHAPDDPDARLARPHGQGAARRAAAARALLLPLRDGDAEQPRRALPDRAARGLQRAGAAGLLLVPELPARLLQRARADGPRGPRLRRQPRRLHLRRGLPLARRRHRRARRPHRPPARGRHPRGDLARRLPRQVQALPQGPGAAEDARALPDGLHLGRPRGAGQLRRRSARRRPAARAALQRGAAAARLQGVLRAHAALRGAARARPPLPHAALRAQRRPDHARRAPVPRRPAVRRRGRRAVPRVQQPAHAARRRARRRSSRPPSSSRRRTGS